MALGQYELKTLLGSGGMGQVWRALDQRLEREVAIKVLPEATASDPEFRGRLLREARLAARLNHPNIATIFAVEEHEASLYLVMELVDGTSLDRLITQGPLAAERVIEFAVQIAAALAEAHAHGIIHRDIKPENVIVSPRGVKVLDFGIAREAASSSSMTQAGIILGTPHYMSPEQAQGFALNGQSDIFSLGAVMYEMLSGRKPFTGDSAMAVLVGVVTQPHAPLASVRADLAAIVDRCLEKRAAARFASARELGEALSKLNHLAPPPVPKPQANQPTVALEKPAIAERRKALVADDDSMARVLLRAALEGLGYEVDLVNDGAEAIKQLKAATYDVLITDLLMPRLDGWSVLDYIRSTPARRPPRVLVTSGMSDVRLGAVDRAMVDAVISKPITKAKLSEALASQS